MVPRPWLAAAVFLGLCMWSVAGSRIERTSVAVDREELQPLLGAVHDQLDHLAHVRCCTTVHL